MPQDYRPMERELRRFFEGQGIDVTEVDGETWIVAGGASIASTRAKREPGEGVRPARKRIIPDIGRREMVSLTVLADFLVNQAASS